jgi:replication factor A1
MQISDLTIGQGKVSVKGVVKGISDVRSFNKYGRELKVANAILEDETGAIKLTLWNDEIMKVKEGCQISIINGFVNEFQGEKQLTAGKFGKIEVL